MENHFSRLIAFHDRKKRGASGQINKIPFTLVPRAFSTFKMAAERRNPEQSCQNTKKVLVHDAYDIAHCSSKQEYPAVQDNLPTEPQDESSFAHARRS